MTTSFKNQIKGIIVGKKNKKARLSHFSALITVLGLSPLSIAVAQTINIPDLNTKINLPQTYTEHKDNTFEVSSGNLGLTTELDNQDKFLKTGGGSLYLMTENHLSKKILSDKYSLPDSINHQFNGTFTIDEGAVISGGNESLGAGLYETENGNSLHTQLSKALEIEFNEEGKLQIILPTNNNLNTIKKTILIYDDVSGGFTKDYNDFIQHTDNKEYINHKLVGGELLQHREGASYEIGEKGTLHLNGFDQTLSNIKNDGKLYLRRGLGGRADKGEEKGSRLNIKENYHGGVGSAIHFGVITADNTLMGDSDKEIDPGATERKDLLVIHGNATGKSTIYVQGVKEVNDTSAEGVSLVYVLGDHKEFQLVQGDRLTEGGVEYWLRNEIRDAKEAHIDHTGKEAKTWFLSKYKTTTPIDPEQPCAMSSVDTCIAPIDPSTPSPPRDIIIAPEVAANLANLKVANEMFAIRYHDRQYLPEYRGIWVRASGTFSDFEIKQDRDLKSTVDYYTIHIGKDLLKSGNFNLGIMGAYGSSDGHSKNHFTDITANHDSHGFALGLYGNYNFTEDSYIDSWIQYAHIRNKVDGWGLESEKYNSKGFLASIEAGHAFKITENIRIQPQAQITWMNVKADNHKSADGSNVSANKGNVQTRLGIRTFNANAEFSPYAAVNYINNSKDYNVKFQGDSNQTEASIAGRKNLYQIELGMATKARQGWNVDGSISLTKGNDSYRNTRLKLDLRYEF